MRLIIPLFLLSFLLAGGCVSTELHGRSEPGFENTRFAKLVVYSDVNDVHFREVIETRFASAAETSQLDVMPSIQLLTESRAYSDEETAALMAAAGIDGMVRIHLDEYSSAVRHVPGGYSTYYGPYGAVVVENAPRRLESTRLIMHMEIVDRASGKVAWTGETVSSGGGMRDLEELAAAAGRRVRDHLYDRNLIGAR